MSCKFEIRVPAYLNPQTETASFEHTEFNTTAEQTSRDTKQATKMWKIGLQREITADKTVVKRTLDSELKKRLQGERAFIQIK